MSLSRNEMPPRPRAWSQGAALERKGEATVSGATSPRFASCEHEELCFKEQATSHP